MQITGNSPAGVVYYNGYTGNTNYPILDMYDNMATVNGNLLTQSINITPWYTRYAMPTVTNPNPIGPLCVGGAITYTADPISPATFNLYSWTPATNSNISTTKVQFPTMNADSK